uniref:Site-specific integrase n=1 Tax=Bosea sp. NBC_00436 TaxID=2969620 RepID=A0A9E7ZJ93_9HYPH
MVRWRSGSGYSQAALAAADDLLDADGKLTLDFQQATRTARDHVEVARAATAAAKAGPVRTVRTVCEGYADLIEARMKRAGVPVSKDVRSRFNKHVLADEIADVGLHTLKAPAIRAWRDRVRAKGLAAATIQRVSNDLRAALNEAGRDKPEGLPDRYPIEVRDGFAKATADRVAEEPTRVHVVLPDADVRRIVVAAREVDTKWKWGGDLARLVLALAATGARFSQLIRCKVADLQTDAGRLMVPVSRKGRGRKTASHTAVPLGEDVIAELRPAIAGRRGHELLFLRPGYQRAGGLKWELADRRPWQPAELTEPFAEIAKRAELSGDTTAYSLRHSSIVRALRANLPVRLTAALHDTSSEMIEKTYSAFISDALSDIARGAIVPLAPVGTPKLRAV